MWLYPTVKICLVVLTKCTNVTDTQTHRYRMTAYSRACIASRGKNVHCEIAETYNEDIRMILTYGKTYFTVDNSRCKLRPIELTDYTFCFRLLQYAENCSGALFFQGDMLRPGEDCPDTKNSYGGPRTNTKRARHG